MTAVMEATEKLLHEADTKFCEKLRLCQNGVATNMNLYSDRTYNLRQQVAHNPQLNNDDHFMEMLRDTEVALAPEFCLRGETDKKLTSLLCGLLKTLLREAVAQQVYSLRKIQIEMIWQWYEDKKKQVLDFAIGRAAGSQSSTALNGTGAADAAVAGCGNVQAQPTTEFSPTAASQTIASTRPANLSKFGSKLRVFVESAPQQQSSSSHHFSGASRDLEIHEDGAAADRATIAKKFSLYKKRNLSKAQRMRDELQAQQTQPLSGVPHPTDVKVVYTKDSKSRQRRVQDARTSLVTMRHGPSGPPTYLHHSSKAPFFTRDAGDRDDLANAVANAQVHVVRHLTSQLAEEHDRRDMRDCMTLFAFNKARLEEETNRRLESESYASQLGRTCHTILRPRTAGSVQPMRFQVGEAIGKTTGTKDLSVPSEALARVAYGGPAVSLSPYDARPVTEFDELKLQNALQRYGGSSGARPSSAPAASHDRSVDVVLAPDAKVTPTVPRVDVPIDELLYSVHDSSYGVPSSRRIEELKLASRVRDTFASDRKPDRPSSAHHYPRAKVEKAVVTPDDSAVEQCMLLLPTYGSFLPRRPQTAKAR